MKGVKKITFPTTFVTGDRPPLTARNARRLAKKATPEGNHGANDVNQTNTHAGKRVG